MKNALDYSQVASILLAEDGDDAIDELAEILSESEEETKSKENSSIDYLFKFDEFLSDIGIYAYAGWMDAVVVEEPVVGRFWVDFYLKLPEDVEMDGAKQLPGPNGVARISVSDDDKRLITISVLRRTLDEIEERNRREAFKSSQAMAQAKLKTKSDGEQNP